MLIHVSLQVIINCSALPSLLHLLSNSRESIKKEACWTISNIAAGNRDQIQYVIDSNIFPMIIEIMGKGDFKTRKEAAWAITNATSGGSNEQIQYLVGQHCIPQLCNLLTVMDPKIIQVKEKIHLIVKLFLMFRIIFEQVALNGLENILKFGLNEAKQNGNGINPYAAMVEECYGLDKIEFLQSHENQDLYKKAYNIIEKYFGCEEEDKEVAPSIGDGQYRFHADAPTNGCTDKFQF